MSEHYPQTPIAVWRVNLFIQGMGAYPPIPSNRRGRDAGGGRRRTSQWKTVCSTCSPDGRGQQYRVRGDVRVRLTRGLTAPVIKRPRTRRPPPDPRLPQLDAIFIIPGVA
jgi:hypothetical protein